MSVKTAGVDWSTLQHKIMVGGRQIGKIYVGNELVYPSNQESDVRRMFLHVSEAHFQLTYSSSWLDGDYYYGFNGRTDLSVALPSECTCTYDIYILFSTPVTIIMDPYTYKTEVRLDGGQYLFSMHFRYTSAEFNGTAYYYEIETEDCSGLSQDHAMVITGRRKFKYIKGSYNSPIDTYSRTYDYLHASYRLHDGNQLVDRLFEEQALEEFFPKRNIDPAIIKRIVGGGSGLIGTYVNSRIRDCTDNSGTLIISPPGSNPSTGSSQHPHYNKASVTDIRTIMQKPYGVDSKGVYVDSEAYCKYKCGYLFSSGSSTNIDETYSHGEINVVPMTEASSYIADQDSLLGYHQDRIWKNCRITFTKLR